MTLSLILTAAVVSAVLALYWRAAAAPADDVPDLFDGCTHWNQGGCYSSKTRSLR